MHIVHLTASTFHGGPERQMLGLARGIRDFADSTFLSFSENGSNHKIAENNHINNVLHRALIKHNSPVSGGIKDAKEDRGVRESTLNCLSSRLEA